MLLHTRAEVNPYTWEQNLHPPIRGLHRIRCHMSCAVLCCTVCYIVCRTLCHTNALPMLFLARHSYPMER